jgi:hypothetical protein
MTDEDGDDDDESEDNDDEDEPDESDEPDEKFAHRLVLVTFVRFAEASAMH